MQLIMVSAVFLAMAARLLLLIWRNEVNVLYYDEWDLYRQFIPHAGGSWLELWRHQPGPHRQGIGYLLMRLIAGASGWNTRAMSFTVAGFAIGAAGLALLLKRRLFGELNSTDAVIPLILISPIQYENVLGAANLPTTSLPIFLIMLYALAWTIARPGWRYFWIVALNFLLIYCGYGFFIGLITPVLLAFAAVAARRCGTKAVAPIAALVAALASLASFFIGYDSSRTAGCSVLPLAPLLHYPWFMAEMFANVLRLKGHGPMAIAGGSILLGLALVLGFRELLRFLKLEPASSENYVLLTLIAFSALYAAAAAVGRICFGVEYGQSSRYAPYLFPAFLAFYFALLRLAPGARRRGLLGIYIAALAIAAVFLSPRDRRTIAYYHQGKESWKACYLRTGDPETCAQKTGFAIYPSPGSPQIRQELQYMETHHLNLFQ